MKYTLYITNKCNMRCGYCYRKKFRNIDISLDEIVKNIVDIMSHKDDVTEIEFLGGEPLLRINIIHYICESIEKYYPNKIVKYSLTTNGTLKNDYIKRIIDKYKIAIFLSIDGTENIHNMHRKMNIGGGSYKNIKWKANEVKLVHITLSKETVPFLYDSVMHIYRRLGFKNISVGIVNTDISGVFLAIYKDQAFRLINKLVSCSDITLTPFFESPKTTFVFQSISDTVEQAFNNKHTKLDKMNEDIYNYYLSKLK